MRIEFWKMHGAGNDFVMADDRAGTFPCGDAEWMARVSARRTGIGCEGVILIQRSDKADFRMRFFNPDGREAEMCGNGARCAARLAHELGVAGRTMKIETVAGILSAEVAGTEVRVGMPRPRDWRMDGTLALGGETVRYSFVNTGVPHAVIETEDLAGCDVAKRGRAIRRHESFAPAGTNANFIHVEGARELKIRTYERGVEGETGACGTGITAAALVAARVGCVTAPVRVTASCGDVLTVDFRLTEDGAENVSLTGPAVYVFRGAVEYG